MESLTSSTLLSDQAEKDVHGGDNRDRTLRNQIKTISAFLIAVLPAVFFLAKTCTEDSISPYDSSLYVANGIFISEAIHDLPNVLKGPTTWMWDYYEQYPALAVRRHPPAFALLEGIVFSVTGNYVRAAHTIIFTLSLIFSLLIYAMCHRAGMNRFSAALTPWLLFSSATVANTGRAIMLDVPMLTAFYAACYFFTKYHLSQSTQNPIRTRKQLILIAILLLLSIYTYQLAVPLVLGFLFFWVCLDGPKSFLNKNVLVTVMISVFLLIPFLVQNLIFSSDDQMKAVLTGTNPTKWHAFESDGRGLTNNWTGYLHILLTDFPIAALAACIAVPMSCAKQLNKFEAFMLTIATAAYCFFGWIPSMSDRYCVYIAIPLTLTLVSFADRFYRSKVTSSNLKLHTCILLATLTGIGWATFEWTKKGSELTTADFFEIANEIQNKQSETKTVVYCGEWDAGFILAMAIADRERKVEVLKAGRQLTKGINISDYLANKKPSLIFYEQEPCRVDLIDRPAVKQAIKQFEQENASRIETEVITVTLTNAAKQEVSKTLRKIKINWQPTD